MRPVAWPRILLLAEHVLDARNYLSVLLSHVLKNNLCGAGYGGVLSPMLRCHIVHGGGGRGVSAMVATRTPTQGKKPIHLLPHLLNLLCSRTLRLRLSYDCEDY